MNKIEILECKACNTGLLITYLLNGVRKENYYNNILELKDQYKLNYNPFSKGLYCVNRFNSLRDNFTTPLEKSIAELSRFETDYRQNEELSYFYRNYNWNTAKLDYKTTSSNFLKLKLACRG